jgi:hypothetical protein
LSPVACMAVPYSSILFHAWHNFQKKVIEHKTCVLTFSYTFVWNISHSKANWVKFFHKCTEIFLQSTHYSCHILIKLEFSWHILKQYSYIRFLENPSSGSQAVPCRWMDRRTDITKL